MGFYSAHSYESSISRDIPVKRKKKKQSDQSINLRRKLQFRSEFDQEDIKTLQKEASQLQKLNITFWKSLCYKLFFFCRKPREVRLMEKSVEHFQNKLDIRSFVRVNTSLNILVNLLLDKKQINLFKY